MIGSRSPAAERSRGYLPAASIRDGKPSEICGTFSKVYAVQYNYSGELFLTQAIEPQQIWEV